ncbi:thioredoxin reductase 1, cytoplasmic-like isoform X1 [Lycorma delicatula]|uniref:thioredoxin reductase 1, cytoplasmic-like isoform X1 n=1 Tax=Lycorma delicatula TaxID=130591 RepID=UPI003F50D802
MFQYTFITTVLLFTFLNNLLYSSTVINNGDYFNLIVIGGGSAGLACAKEAAKYNKSVIVLDYTVPSPRGTSWGVGGTCVNAGCIPKKLFHQASLLKKYLHDMEFYGWEMNNNIDKIKNSWSSLIENVGNYISSLRWKIRRDLNLMNIKLLQAIGTFIDHNTVNAKIITGKLEYDQKLKFKNVTIRGENILIAVGTRPTFPKKPVGISKYCITSDDLFYLEQPPGKTAVIGAGYIGLECAGFLNGLGFPVKVITRSVLLRNFDQDMVNLVKQYMIKDGITFCTKCEVINVVPTNSSEQLKYDKTGYIVTWRDERGREYRDFFNTILCATGRLPFIDNLNLRKAGVNYDNTTGKIYTANEKTSVQNIFAAGDVISGKPELTSVAVQAGNLLAKRLFGNLPVRMDYYFIPTTVFTPLEYGCVGYSEDNAIEKYGEEFVEVYHGYYYPLEWEMPRADGGGDNSLCYIKVISLKRSDKIIGVHFTGPHAGDVIQGFAVAVKNGLTVRQLQNSVGIHPTIAEEFTRISITKRSGLSPRQLSCCS